MRAFCWARHKAIISVHTLKAKIRCCRRRSPARRDRSRERRQPDEGGGRRDRSRSRGEAPQRHGGVQPPERRQKEGSQEREQQRAAPPMPRGPGACFKACRAPLPLPLRFCCCLLVGVPLLLLAAVFCKC